MATNNVKNVSNNKNKKVVNHENNNKTNQNHKKINNNNVKKKTIHNNTKKKPINNNQQIPQKVVEIKEIPNLEETMELPKLKAEVLKELEKEISLKKQEEIKEESKIINNEKNDEEVSIKKLDVNNNINMKTNNVKTVNVKKIIKGVGLTFFLILAVSAIIFSLSILKIGLLPTKYLIILNIVLLFVLFGVFLLANGKKKKTNLISSVISIVLSIVFIIGSMFVFKTEGTLRNFFKPEAEEINYSLYVDKESTYNKIEDLASINVGILRENSVNVKKYLEKYGIIVNVYDTLGEITLALGSDIQGIAINKDMFLTIKELDVEFGNKVKDIHNFKLKIGKDIERVEEAPVEEETEEQKQIRLEMERRKAEIANLQKGNSFVVYITGIDASGGNSAANSGLSDVNMLVVVNPDKNKLLLVSIPRDYYVYVNGKKDKLTHAGLYGVNTSIKAVENIFNVKVDYYLKVCFGAVTTLVDDIDGIEVYSDTAFNSYHLPGWYVQKGNNHLDGKKALAYARERYAYTGGDRHRVQNQQDVISAIISKVSTNTSYLLKFNDILEHVSPYIATNIPYDKMQSTVKKQLNSLKGWDVIKYSVDGFNSWNYSASFPASPAYVMEPNYNTIFTAQDKIIDIIKG